MPSGEVPPHQGMPLTQLPADQVAEIVHLEDEPDAVFAQIVAAGLMPGMRVRVLERSPKRLRIEAETDEVVLAPVVAANVTVLPIEQPAADASAMTRLSAIAPGRSGRGRGAGGDVSWRPAPSLARPRRRPGHARHQRAARAVGRSDRLPDSRRPHRAAPRSGPPHLRPQGVRGHLMSHPSPEACATCPAHHLANLKKLGVDMAGHDFVVALAGNPNTGKSTVFNALTGLRQHTGNWPGKTVTRAEGGVRDRRPPLQARRSAGHLLAALGQPRRRGGARLHPVRPARRHGDRRRRHHPRAQPEPGAAGARNHQPRRRLPQPDGRGAACAGSTSTRAVWPATSACGSCRRRPVKARGCPS